ncbi:PLP-dependent aminotransferase family protein [Lysinibacillus xylanilyticus]|uniref:MocR-like pyridoxine biosynthesis transcription factor PdxR n=1 Tax=Lysinibacillus xylanilyticus TaxID=582475 RepID=UPI002B2533BC|nr:PLP-dependent aminotransferase family protein [Lysinibacillus xylanilyticus]MEB2299260.1 PLP-dependent aminotransferase family protein [Lysinibacillus xylanilyticus]
MKIKLNRQSDQSLIHQISNILSEKIRAGFLEEGSQLPSLRTFSKENQVSLVTVSKAYALLEKNGYIQLKHGKGAFVRERKQRTSTKSKNDYNWQLAIPDYIHRSQYMLNVGIENSIKLSSATIHPGLLPSTYLSKEIFQVLQEDPQIVARYGPVQGDYAVREAIKNYVQQHCQIQTKPQEIIITNGVQQGIDLVARTFIGPGDIVITEAPTYTAAIDVFRNRGAHIIPVPIDEEGMQTEILASLCLTKKPKLVYTNPTFQNPTGTVLSEARRNELLELAQHNSFLIIEDDSWNEIYFEDNPPPPTIKSLDRNGHVIYLKGFSKALAPSCRIGAIISNGTVHQRLLSAKSSADLGSPLLTQKALIPFLSSNRMNTHLEKLRIALEVRRDQTIKLLEKYAPESVTWVIPKGGLNIWVSLPSDKNADEVLFKAQQSNISFLPSSACYPGEPQYNHMRISYSYPDHQELEWGIIELCKIITLYLHDIK